MVCNREYDSIFYFYFCFVLSIWLPLILAQVKCRDEICMESCKIAVSTTEAIFNKSGTTESRNIFSLAQRSQHLVKCIESI